MTTHRRAWLSRAGVVAALAAVTLVALPIGPAQAAPPQVTIEGGEIALSSGQRSNIAFTVTNRNEEDGPTTFAVQVSLTVGDVRCEGSDCARTGVEIAPGATTRFQVTLVTGNLGTNQTRDGQIVVRAEAVNGESGQVDRRVTARGPQEEPRVREVAGKVTDISTGEPIEGAVVAMSDSRNNAYDTTTNASGNYRFTSSADRPIAPGDIRIGAVADGYDRSDARVITAAAGQSVTVDRITLKATAAPTPSPTPEASAEPSAEPTPSAESSASAPPVDTENLSNESSSGGGMGSWLLIIMGGLLVALGVGAIVLLLVRRKDSAEDDEADPVDDGPGGGQASVPGSHGVYHGADDDATRVAMPTMPDGPVTDATMITPRPSLSDAPTMLHNMAPIKDEFADPYGAPPPGQNPPGGAPDPRYGGEQRPGWGGPPSQPAYGASAGATSVYGAVPGRDATGPAGSGGYGGAAAAGSARPGGYGDAPSSGAPGGYGSAPSSGSPYGSAPPAGGPGGYGNAPSSGGPYGGAPSSGGPYGGAPSSGGPYGNAPSSEGPYGNAPSSGAPGGYGNAPSAGNPYGGAPSSAAPGGYGNASVPGQYGAPAGRPPMDEDGGYRAGRGYGGDPGPAGYPGGGYGNEPAGGGYGGERYDEPTGRYEPDGYSRGGSSYDSGGYGSQEHGRSDVPPPRGPEPPQAGYRGGAPAGGYGGGQDSAGYGGGYGNAGYGGGPADAYGDNRAQPASGYPAGGYGGDQGREYGSDQGYRSDYPGGPSGPGGYGPPAGTGYDQPGGYPPAGGGGYDDRRAPDQRGGYEQPPYGQQPYDPQQYSGEQPPGDQPRHGGPATPPAGRSGERRSLDWLDD